jgi:hypothetical protein
VTSGRSGTGDALYRKNRALVLADSDCCHLCGHAGARTVDHVITAADWPKDANGRPLPGLNDISNLLPAHGTMGNRATGTLNPCPTCGQLCNQVRGRRPVPQATRSRDW